tara:strand:+ start:435 stop:812 length:378 start_codon:yes stop_codon:yes gene_type:complete
MLAILQPLWHYLTTGRMNRPSLGKGNDTMSNYTDAMIARIKASAPLNIEKARELAAEFGLSHRSVISKAKHLDVEYTPAVRKAASKDTGPTKAETLAAIRLALALPEREGDLTKAELVRVAEHIG